MSIPLCFADEHFIIRMCRFLVLFILTLAGCSCNSTQTSHLSKILHQQTELYPELQIDDVYKLLYQGTLGIEHLLSDTTAAKNYLEHEWRGITADNTESLLEIISPDSQWVRFNLKPYKAAGGTTEAVWRAMRRSANIHGDKEIFLRRWHEFMSLVNKRQLPFDRAAVREFNKRMTAEQYPAAHHSQIYIERYQPAYRVLLRAAAIPLEQQLSEMRR